MATEYTTTDNMNEHRKTTLEVLMWRIKSTQKQIENEKKYLEELETAYDAILNMESE